MFAYIVKISNLKALKSIWQHCLTCATSRVAEPLKCLPLETPQPNSRANRSIILLLFNYGVTDLPAV